MQLIINISNPILRQYLLSSLKRNDEGCVISSRTATGMLVCALARPSESPDRKLTDQSVVLSLPINRATMPLRYRFVTLRAGDQLAINSMLHREFNIEFNQFLNEGQQLGFRRKELIEMFIEKYHLFDIPSVFDTLAKKRYRSKIFALRIFGSPLPNSKLSTPIRTKISTKCKQTVA